MKIISGTGHRPDKLGGYDWDVFHRLTNLAAEHLREHRPDLVISGMALGWDQALARAAIQEKIPFHAYIPCRGQDGRWPQESQEAYHQIVQLAEWVRYTHDGSYPGPQVMLRRNVDMVNATTCHVVALWNGSDGGTKHCVVYARKNNVPVINLWDRWTELNTASQ
jgi:uncharacterized phage-like protein YoqJ